MKAKAILRIALLAFVAGSLAVWGAREFVRNGTGGETPSPAADDALPAVSGPQVVMTFFSLGKPCTSCRKIRALTEKVAKSDFAEELASGKLAHREVDTDLPENRHFLKDYELAFKTVVLSRRVDGKETSWKNMEDVWEYFDQPEVFREYLGDEIRRMLKP